jgi:glycosyltransferase involved in cell wall biosynthesis
LVGWATDAQRAALLRRLDHDLPADYAHLANDNPDHQNLAETSRFLSGFNDNSRLHVLGPTATPERWYKSFHVFCSLSAAEGFGLTLAEAAAAGLPVVACDTPALRQTLAEARFITPNPTPAAVAAALLAARDDHKPLSIEELERRYSLDTMVRSYASFFQSLLDSRA